MSDKPVAAGKRREHYLLLFFVSFFGMMLAFLPTMVKNGGIFLYYGDFNSQQMMFYYHANEMVRSGQMAWDWGTDLGSNFIGSYSFYLLGSPFFWLSTLFPMSAVKYLIPWLLALKTSVAALTSYAYIRRFVKSSDASFIGAMLYAFSGFQLYNVFFNHFHDVTAFFPLLLLTFEMLTQDGRRGVFALCVALCACISYFFFACEVVFVVIYFFIRCLDKEFRMNFKIFGELCLESVIGVAISCFILLPACMDIISNPRVSGRLYGNDIVFYGESVRVPRIIQGFFMMSDMPARTNILASENARWSSMAGYLPMFSMCGVIAFMRDKQKHWATKLTAVCAIMMCVPWLNSIFVLFNNSYYARWYYMPILIMCLMTAKIFAQDPDKLKKGFKATLCVILFFLAVGLLPKLEDGKVIYGQNYQYPEMYYMQLSVTIVLTAILAIIIYKLPRTANFRRITAGVTAAACIITMFAGVNFGAIQDGNHEEYIEYAINGKENLDMQKIESMSDVNSLYEDNTFYRIDTSENVDNWCMFWDLPSMRTFHSVVPTSIINFYESIGQTRDVASRMEPNLYALRSMFSVRYYFDRAKNKIENDPTVYGQGLAGSELNNDPNDMELYDNKYWISKVPGLTGFEYVGTQNDFNIFENQYWIPMGFTYDYYTDQKSLDNTNKERRPNLLLEAVMLDDSLLAKYSDILKPYEYESSKLQEEHFKEVCEQKRKTACYYFQESTNGFEAKINLDSDKLLFFSVPYEDGWTAEVNGVPVEIDKVNFGFMAIRCPAGSNDIVFSYKTAGLKEGTIISIGGAGLFLFYMAAGFILDKRKKTAPEAAPSNDPEHDDTDKNTDNDISDNPDSVIEDKAVNEEAGQTDNVQEISEDDPDNNIADDNNADSGEE